ncbi:hypothetical protein BaRGS_00010486 [Batillaria attramentaria]|uniref:Uncharacterized protein n=1 Tax=Batillaria attramentaria TaxID=370345 RepID=A0ABD0LGA3_9CAEN
MSYDGTRLRKLSNICCNILRIPMQPQHSHIDYFFTPVIYSTANPLTTVLPVTGAKPRLRSTNEKTHTGLDTCVHESALATNGFACTGKLFTYF